MDFSATFTEQSTEEFTQEFTQKLAALTPDASVQAWVNAQFEQMHNALDLTNSMLAIANKKLSDHEANLHVANLKNQALILELAHLRRMRFGKSSEAIGVNGNNITAHTRELFEDSVNGDIAEVLAEIEQAQTAAVTTTVNTELRNEQNTRAPRSSAGRQKLPAHLPRTIHRHELPESECHCTACGEALVIIREDVSEQLDVTPAQFSVHQHIRPQYACKHCEQITAAPIPATIVDGGLAAPGLISWMLTSKFVDHLPLYRLEYIAARSGVNLARSTLSDWVYRYCFALLPLVERMRILLLQRAVLHADETPIKQLAPGSGTTKRAYLWAYGSGEFEVVTQEGAPSPQSPLPPIVIFDYHASRAGVHARNFLAHWRGHLMCDDYTGYKALFDAPLLPPVLPQSESIKSTTSGATQSHIIELGCMAHARRKYFELHAANGSAIAYDALQQIAALYEIEARIKTMPINIRQSIRQSEAAPKLDEMKRWLIQSRINAAKGSALAKAIDYSLRRWEALSRYAQSGHLPIDNNLIENAIRPIAIGKKNWLFIGSERTGKRTAAIQSLFATAKRNGLDPAQWLTDVLTKLPTHPNSRIDELLPFRGYQVGALADNNSIV